MDARPVLVIDSDPTWCARVCRLLETEGTTAVAARDLDATLRQLDVIGKPSVVVMEHASRRGNGVAQLSTLRKLATLHDVPFVFVKKTAELQSLLLMLTLAAQATQRAA